MRLGSHRARRARSQARGAAGRLRSNAERPSPAIRRASGRIRGARALRRTGVGPSPSPWQESGGVRRLCEVVQFALDEATEVRELGAELGDNAVAVALPAFDLGGECFGPVIALCEALERVGEQRFDFNIFGG